MTRVAFDAAFDPPAPVLPVRIGGLDEERAAVMLRMLVDTGADCTLIPVRVARSLQLPLVDRVELHGVGPGAHQAGVYAARIRVADLRMLARVVAFGEEVLLGRDILNRLVLRIDGPAGTVAAERRRTRPKR
jgi:predicted aspartyl protease